MTNRIRAMTLLLFALVATGCGSPSASREGGNRSAEIAACWREAGFIDQSFWGDAGVSDATTDCPVVCELHGAETQIAVVRLQCGSTYLAMLHSWGIDPELFRSAETTTFPNAKSLVIGDRSASAARIRFCLGCRTEEVDWVSSHDGRTQLLAIPPALRAAAEPQIR